MVGCWKGDNAGHLYLHIINARNLEKMKKTQTYCKEGHTTLTTYTGKQVTFKKHVDSQTYGKTTVSVLLQKCSGYRRNPDLLLLIRQKLHIMQYRYVIEQQANTAFNMAV